MLLGPKLNTVFASRWKAVLWSLSVLLLAYCSVPSPDKNGVGDPDVAMMRMAGTVMGGHPADKPKTDAHRNPWAKDPPK